MSEVTISLPPSSIPKPLPPSSIVKPLPPPILTSGSKGVREKQRVQRARYKFSPPTLPPPAPPTIPPSPPPYSSISPPPSPPPSKPHQQQPVPSATQQHTRNLPARPPPPAIAPPSAPPRPPTPNSPSAPPPPSHPSDPPPYSSPNQEETLDANGEVILNTSSEGVEEGGRESGSDEGGGEAQEPHYKRAPVSQGGAGVVLEGENDDSGPEYVNIDSLDEEEEEEAEEEHENGQPSRHSIIRQDYQNWDFIGESDSDENDDNCTPQPSHRHHPPTQSNPPTLPLNTHPVLMTKHSSRGFKSKEAKGKHRNRAPPPPPGVKAKGRGSRGGSKEHEKDRMREADKGKEREREREREIGVERMRMADREREKARAGEREKVVEEKERGQKVENENEESQEEAEGEGEEHDYSTIPRTDYINWEFEQDDGSESDEESSSATPKPKTHKPSNPPTLPLNTHPILMRSHSHDNVVESAEDADMKRPKNRAPPPPPSKTKSKPPRGFSHQLSQPHTQFGNEASALVSREGGEYARVTKPPPAHKRTKSDQQPVHADKEQYKTPKDKQQLYVSPKDKQAAKDKQQEPKQPLTPVLSKNPKVSRSSPSNSQQSPLTTHKNGDPLDHKRRSPLPTRAGERDMAQWAGGGKVSEGPPSRPPPRTSAGVRKRQSTAETELDGRSTDREPLHANSRKRDSSGGMENLMRPKRQAPPPPAGRAVSVEETEERDSRESPQGAAVMAATAEKQIKEEARLQTPPPKPKRLHRRTPPIPAAIETEALPTTQESTEVESSVPVSPRAENGEGMDRWERLLYKMEFFTIDLIKEGDRSLGMVIVSGKVMNKDGSSVEGIFIQKILPGSLTDKDGRIQAGDMLVEINGVAMVGGSVELASRKLKDTKESVKLKVGRPDRGTFRVPGEENREPIYVNNDDIEDSELKAKLDKAEARAAKMEELQSKAEKDLKVFREMADKEQKSFHKRLEEAEEKLESYKKESQGKITDLTIALANITVEKTKLEKEVESLKYSHSSSQDGDISSLKRELKEAESERDMAERDLRQLRQEMEAGASLQSRLSELDSNLAQAQRERDAMQSQLESTCHELSVAHATLEQMQREKRAVQEENERVSLELVRERKPSSGRMGIESELAQRKRELSTAQRELHELRDEKEKAGRETEEVRRELEREREKNKELEKMLEKENTTIAELQSQHQTQAKQMDDLKEESSKAKPQGSTVAVETEYQEHGSGMEDRETDTTVGKRPEIVTVEASPERKRSHSPALTEKEKYSSGKSSPAKESKSPQHTKGKLQATAEDSISIEAFDEIKPVSVLDNTLAKDKSQAALRNAKKLRNRPSREHIRSMSVENLLGDSPLEGGNPEAATTDNMPVPRPRKHTMEENPHQKPLPIPRHHPRSPPSEPPLRPPKPADSEKGGQASPDRKVKFGRKSPPRTRAPSPKPLLPPTGPPKPVPRRMNKPTEDGSADEAQSKDPSQLTVKERMELAQKAMVKKPPPVVPKKPSANRPHGDSEPRSLSQPEGDESEIPGTRQSLDTAHSPRPVKRLPPGAFNIGLMTPLGQRQRSNTVATSREHSMEREEGEEYKKQMKKEEERDMGSREALDTDDIEIKFPPQRPPLPMTRRAASNEKPAQLSSRNNDVVTEAAPPLTAAADRSEGQTEEPDGEDKVDDGERVPEPSSLDYSQVLTWSPAHVGSWMKHIGLSQHAAAFLDKGVQGNRLFDIDGSGLKAMGVSSPDDRALFKREIKALRPHAERQKKLLEKQRKDDKKKKKKQFV